MSVGGRALDWLIHLGLGFRTFGAHGINTDIYAITPTKMRGRTNLAIDYTDHWLYVLPSRGEYPSQVDWIATAEGQGTVKVRGEQVITLSGMRMWGEWHADFHRTSAVP